PGEAVDLPLQPVDLLRRDPGDLLRSGRRVRSRELRAEREQLALQLVEERAQIPLRQLLAGDAERGVQLVHVAIRGHTKVLLAHPGSAEEPGRAVIAATRVDLCQAASVAR